MVKAEVCKISIHRFDSDRRLNELSLAGVAKLVDARDLKSLGLLKSVPVRFRPSAHRTVQYGIVLSVTHLLRFFYEVCERYEGRLAQLVRVLA